MPGSESDSDPYEEPVTGRLLLPSHCISVWWRISFGRTVVFDITYSRSVLRGFVSWVALCIVSTSAAYAAATVQVPLRVTGNVFPTYAGVFSISIAGWAVHSLPVLADWGDGTVKRRLIIVQGVIQAVFFGFLGFASAAYVGQNIVACYIAAAGGAYCGERFFPFWKINLLSKSAGEPQDGAK